MAPSDVPERGNAADGARRRVGAVMLGHQGKTGAMSTRAGQDNWPQL